MLADSPQKTVLLLGDFAYAKYFQDVLRDKFKDMEFVVEANWQVLPSI
jgi:hypothetical protein